RRRHTRSKRDWSSDVCSSDLRHDLGLSTIIGRTDRDASGNRLDVATRTRMRRLKIWDSRSQAYTPTDRSLQQAFFQLDVLKDKQIGRASCRERVGIMEGEVGV